MERKVNGKSLEEALKILTKKTKPTKTLTGKYPYWPIDSYIDRMNEAFGPLNYSVESLSDIKADRLDNGQIFFSTRCRVTIFDDEGKVVCFKDGFGAKEPTLAKETGKDGGIKNLPNNAFIAAFKAACHQLNIFSVRVECDESASENSESEDADNHSKSSEKIPTVNKVFSLKPDGDFFKEREDKDGKPIYHLKAYDPDNKEKFLIIFYPNQYGKDTEKFNRLLVTVSNKGNIRLNIKASVSSVDSAGVTSIVFKGYEA